MTTRAKFYCNSVTDFGNNSKQVAMSVVYAPNANNEDANFTKATPSGEIKMAIGNPAASCQFVPGKYYYADFTQVEE